MCKIKLNSDSTNALIQLQQSDPACYDQSITKLANRLILEHSAISDHFKQDKKARTKRIKLSAN